MPSRSERMTTLQGLKSGRRPVDEYSPLKGKDNVYSVTARFTDGSQREGQHVLEPLLSSRTKAVVLLLLVFSVGHYLYMWHYWVALNRSSSWPLLNVWVTAVFAWYTLTEVLRQVMLMRAKCVRQDLPIPTYFRVGMVVTKVCWREP